MMVKYFWHFHSCNWRR